MMMVETLITSCSGTVVAASGAIIDKVSIRAFGMIGAGAKSTLTL